jgi:hypothetical protein
MSRPRASLPSAPGGYSAVGYDEIADVMGMNRNSVAQLLSRARLWLRSELRGTAGAAVAAGGECGRALPLLALADDAELRDQGDARWLAARLSGCARCVVAQEVMAEAGESYRSWLPFATRTRTRRPRRSSPSWRVDARKFLRRPRLSGHQPTPRRTGCPHAPSSSRSP